LIERRLRAALSFAQRETREFRRNVSPTLRFSRENRRAHHTGRGATHAAACAALAAQRPAARSQKTGDDWLGPC
jgi:hypothetical protein